jgi:hypothetical protein
MTLEDDEKKDKAEDKEVDTMTELTEWQALP